MEYAEGIWRKCLSGRVLFFKNARNGNFRISGVSVLQVVEESEVKISWIALLRLRVRFSQKDIFMMLKSVGCEQSALGILFDVNLELYQPCA